MQVGVALHKARARAGANAEQVVPHEHLPVGLATGTDADGRDPDAFGDGSGNLGRYAFKHEREGAGGFHSDRILNQLQRSVGCAALRAEAAERGRTLGRQAEMTHHRNPRTNDRADAVEGWSSALYLDGVGAGLLDEPARDEDGVAITRLKAHKGHVGDDEGGAISLAGTARRSGREDDHLVDRDRHGGVMPQHGHGGGIADQNHINAGFGGCLAARSVVRSDHHEWDTGALLCDQIGQCDLPGSRSRGGGTTRAGAHADSFAKRASPAEAGAMGSSSRLSIRRVLPMRPAISTTAGRWGSYADRSAARSARYSSSSPPSGTSSSASG